MQAHFSYCFSATLSWYSVNILVAHVSGDCRTAVSKLRRPLSDHSGRKIQWLALALSARAQATAKQQQLRNSTRISVQFLGCHRRARLRVCCSLRVCCMHALAYIPRVRYIQWYIVLFSSDCVCMLAGRSISAHIRANGFCVNRL